MVIPDADPETTSIYVVKPEPGRDIFAGEVPDARSKARPPLPAVVDEDAIINSVLQMTTASESAEASAAGNSEASASPSASSASAADGSSSSAAATANAPPPAEVKLAGPLGEAEAEADKVAHELFPDAAEK